jgi:predicted regulator of Ras-like GTPase activity (Roadblock/LC7/MglB family)
MDESILEDLAAVKGYLGSAISNYTGECLICDADKLTGNLEEVSATFNDIFRDSHAVSKRLSLGSTQIMEIHTEKAVILMGCSGEDSRVHLHMFAVFKSDGNVALGKMTLKRILPKAVEMLS